MALKIVKCEATPSSITVFFSDAVNATPTADANFDRSALKAANYTVTAVLPAGATAVAIPAPLTYDAPRKSATGNLPLVGGKPLTQGTWLTVVVKNVTLASDLDGKAGTAINDNGIDNTTAVQINGKPDVADVTESVEDAVSYPLLTEQVSFPPSGGPGPSPTGIVPTPVGGSLGQTVAKAVTDVLGWKLNASDPKGFLGALTQSFSLTEVEGHVEATWKPRTYAVQTDLGGGITGAQASLYTRAKDALEQSLSLLDGLYPLDPEADQEDVKALREMAKSQMNEIVRELGTLGGPSIQRVNVYFTILLGRSDLPVEFEPDRVRGTLGSLRDTYGIFFLKNPFSNSVEDEQVITNFRMISDHMTGLLQSWVSNRDFFSLAPGASAAFFGTQLVKISQQFSVIGEAVNEVEFAMDSVFIGPSERQTLLLQFASFPPMYIADVLHEVLDFASDEGPRLLRDGGRFSVENNILPVSDYLAGLVDQSRSPGNIGDLPDGYRTVRVQRSLDDLRGQLIYLGKLIAPLRRDLPAPENVPPQSLAISGVSPVSGTTDTTVVVTVKGQGFDPNATCVFTNAGGNNPVADAVSFLSPNTLVVTLDLSPADPGSYDLTVTNPGSPAIIATLGGAFTVSLADVNFDRDKADIEGSEKPKLDTAAAFLKRNPKIKVILEGHCDVDGTDAENDKLGQERADAVKKGLEGAGIDAIRITTKSFGKRFATPPAKRADRRVHFRLQTT